MNPAYDKQAAVLALETLTQDRLNNPHRGLHLSTMFDEATNITYAPVLMPTEGIWRLAYGSPDGDFPDETIVSFQGILCSNNLPPFKDAPGVNSRQAKYLRQSITTTALGSSTFDKILTNIARVHACFDRSIGEGRLQACSIFTTFENTPALDLYNRYFTPRATADVGDIRELGHEVDPQGILARAAGSTYIHTEENKVYYYQRRLGEQGTSYSFIPAPLHIFQVGDIVEVQVPFVGIPLKERKVKMAMILCSVTLLDGSISQKAAVHKFSFGLTIPSRPKPGLKRKVGYADEEVSSTREKMQRMHIDGEAGANDSEPAGGRWENSEE